MPMNKYRQWIPRNNQEDFADKKKETFAFDLFCEQSFRLEKRSISMVTINDPLIRINDSVKCLFRGNKAIVFAL